MLPSSASSRAKLQQIADRLGVSRMTVSRALRGISYVKEDLKARILKEAERVGYKCTPTVSRIMGELRHSKQLTYHETVAFLYTQSPYYDVVFSGVQAMAAKLGYRVDCLIPDSSPSLRRGRQLTRVLRARGVRGVLLAPLTEVAHPHVTLEWKYFSTVLVGTSLANRGLARVQFDHFAACKLLLRKMQHLGYRRIGLVLSRYYHERSNRQLLAAFQAWHPRPSEAGELTYFYKEGEVQQVKEWIRARRLDSIIGGPGWLEFLGKDSGFRIPAKLGFASLLVGDRAELTGTQTTRNLFQIGTEAMRTLDGQLREGRLGLQQLPVTVNVPPDWQAGVTAVRH